MSLRIARASARAARQLAIVFPRARDRVFVNRALGRAEFRARGGNVRQRAIQPHVALALLLGIVERMRVQKRPDELPAHVFEAKFEMRVLVDGVMPAVKRGRADGHALLVGDFLGNDQMRRVAGARRGNGRIERMRERVAQRDARRRRLHLRSDG